MLLQPLLSRVSYLCLLCWQMPFSCLDFPLFGPSGKGTEGRCSVRLCLSSTVGQRCQEAFLPFWYSLPVAWVSWPKAFWTISQELGVQHSFYWSYEELSASLQRNWPSCPLLASLQDREKLLLFLLSFPANPLLLKLPLSPICIWSAIYFVAHFW